MTRTTVSTRAGTAALLWLAVMSIAAEAQIDCFGFRPESCEASWISRGAAYVPAAGSGGDLLHVSWEMGPRAFIPSAGTGFGVVFIAAADDARDARLGFKGYGFRRVRRIDFDLGIGLFLIDSRAAEDPGVTVDGGVTILDRFRASAAFELVRLTPGNTRSIVLLGVGYQTKGDEPTRFGFAMTIVGVAAVVLADVF